MRPETRPIHWLRCLLAIAIVILSFSAVQADDEGFFSLQLENDLWGSSDDRFYTHGTELSFASIDPPPQYLSDIARWIPWYREGDISLYGYEIAQKIFTPEDITVADLIEDDRPYAGWLYFNTGIGHIYQDLGDRESMNLLGYTIGIIGPASLAEHSQTLVHEIVDADAPKGWSHQLGPVNTC
jgi:hypothetical protein